MLMNAVWTLLFLNKKKQCVDVENSQSSVFLEVFAPQIPVQRLTTNYQQPLVV